MDAPIRGHNGHTVSHLRMKWSECKDQDAPLGGGGTRCSTEVKVGRGKAGDHHYTLPPPHTGRSNIVIVDF